MYLFIHSWLVPFFGFQFGNKSSLLSDGFLGRFPKIQISCLIIFVVTGHRKQVWWLINILEIRPTWISPGSLHSETSFNQSLEKLKAVCHHKKQMNWLSHASFHIRVGSQHKTAAVAAGQHNTPPSSPSATRKILAVSNVLLPLLWRREKTIFLALGLGWRSL